MRNTPGILYEAGTAYPLRAPAFTPGVSMGSVLLIFIVLALSYYVSLRFYVLATKCPAHIVLPMSVIPYFRNKIVVTTFFRYALRY